MKPINKKLLVVTAAISLLIVGINSASVKAQEKSDEGNNQAQPNSSTPNTVPGKGTPSDTNIEVETIALSRGVSVAEARASLVRQDSLIRSADQYRTKNPSKFVDFKIDDVAATSGTFMVEPGTTAGPTVSDSRLGAPLNYVEAKVSRAERERERQEAATEFGIEADDVFYDSFNDIISVNVPQDKAVRNDRSRRGEDLGLRIRQDRSRKDTAPKVAINEADPNNRGFFGGLITTKSGGGICTTGFGLYKSGAGGYLTAAHCGLGTWTVNGSTSSNVLDRYAGGYGDTQVINAAGASWFLTIGRSPTGGRILADMAASPDQWIYQNTTYCTYSDQTWLANCGVLATSPGQSSPYNVVFSDFGFSRWATTTNMLCQPGDSGGPMWRPVPGGESKPVGTVEGGYLGNGPDSTGRYPCAFMKLYDQLSNNGWSLL
jgi:hypothetical protein